VAASAALEACRSSIGDGCSRQSSAAAVSQLIEVILTFELPDPFNQELLAIPRGHASCPAEATGTTAERC
jgi:hypothetical protein